ncbi:MFS transporter [Bradyrhizobium sp. ISRA435]|nr:MFS transporter [Bradyrhizobium sp. ISRA435]
MSLFGDMTYEGARSIVGPYLAVLGASATVVGVAAGFGEFVGYALRLLSGYIGDRTGRYWTVTIAGYFLNLFAVPLLAIAGNWQIAVLLMVTERIGRALRAPTRDAMLSHAATRTGAGWAFGLHEAMDTTGAVIGPLAISAALYFGHGYAASFAMLVVPAILSIAVLLIARQQFPAPRDLEIAAPIRQPAALPRQFWLFSFAAAFIGAGYADFSLLAYHFGKTGVIAAPWVPLLYAVAMVAAAVASLALGPVFDRIGLALLIPVTLVSAVSAPLAFLGGGTLISFGIICWGIGMGTQESVMRAAVGSMTTRDRRGTAFGLFHTIFGVGWFAGSIILGMTYDRSVTAVAILAFALQLLALPLLWIALHASVPRHGQTRSRAS